MCPEISVPFIFYERLSHFGWNDKIVVHLMGLKRSIQLIWLIQKLILVQMSDVCAAVLTTYQIQSGSKIKLD